MNNNLQPISRTMDELNKNESETSKSGKGEANVSNWRQKIVSQSIYVHTTTNIEPF